MRRKSRILPIVASAIGLMIMVAPAGAQAPGPGGPGTPLSDQNNSGPNLAAFLADPTSLLARYPNGGGSMVADVRDLAQADLSTVNVLLSLIPSANTDQKTAIGTGLGLAALALVKTNPQAGTIIQDALVKLNDPTILTAYAAVTGNQRLAAAGPGGGGGSAGAGESATGTAGASGGISSPSSLFPNFDTANTADSFTFPTFTGSTPGTGTTTTTTVSTSVSPTSL